MEAIGVLIAVAVVAAAVVAAGWFLWRRPIVEKHTNGPWRPKCKNISLSSGDEWVTATCKNSTGTYGAPQHVKAKDCKNGLNVHSDGTLACCSTWCYS